MNNIKLINPVIYRKRRDMSFNKTILIFLILLIFSIYINITSDTIELNLYYNKTHLKTFIKNP
jgi:hypothetical protein